MTVNLTVGFCLHGDGEETTLMRPTTKYTEGEAQRIVGAHNRAVDGERWTVVK